MIVFPLLRSLGLRAATASSRVETLPRFVRSRPSRTRWTISPSWARSDSTTKSTARPSAGRASGGPTTDTSVPPARTRRADRQKALDFGAQEFVDLEHDALEDIGSVDLVFDLIGGDIGKRSARLVRAGGTLVSIVGPSEARPADGLAVDFVVESDRAQLSEIVQRVRDGRLRTNIGTVATLDDAVAAFNPTKRTPGKTIIRARP